MLTYAEALALIADLPPMRGHESVPLAEAGGRVLAEAVRLNSDQPPFDRATMDGFAVVLPGTNVEHGMRFRLRGTVLAGSAHHGTLQPGDAVRIMTGAPAPHGTTVVPIELTDQAQHPQPAPGVTNRTWSEPTEVVVTDVKALAPRRNIAWRGEDGHGDDIVIAAGTVLGPATLAVAAMAGARQVMVAAAPRLTCITTGDEVGKAGAAEAGINDSNGPFLAALARTLGLSCRRAHAADDAIALRAAVVEGFDHAEIVVTTGGVSAGDKDLVPVIAPSLGLTTVFHHIAMQPGKPVFVARRADGRMLVGLPGNPVSVLATAHLILWPILRRLQGLRMDLPWMSLPLTTELANRGKRQLFLPALRERTANGLMVRGIPWNGSGDLIAAAAGDCLVDLPLGTRAAAGIAVNVLPYLGTEPGSTGTLPPRAPHQP